MADEAAARAFVENDGAKLPKRGNPVVRGVDRKRPRAVSDKQQADTDIATGIMAERVYSALGATRHFSCECWQLGSDFPRAVHYCGHRVLAADFGSVGAAAQFVVDNWHPHHEEKRSRGGPRANRHNVFTSRSRPENIFVIHPDCHRRIHA